MAPYLTLCREDAPQRMYSLRAVFNGLRYMVTSGMQWRMMAHDLPHWRVVYHQTQRWIRAGCFETMVEDLRSLLREFAGRNAKPTAMILDSRTLRSTPESGARAGYDGAKRRKGSKVHAAVDTLGHLLALHATSADQQDRAHVERLAAEVQQISEENVQLAYVDQGYTGQAAAEAANQHGIQLEVDPAYRGEMRLCAPATPLGRRAKLRLGCAIPAPRPGLRTPLNHPRRFPLLRLRLAHARQNLYPAQPKLRTASSEYSKSNSAAAPSLVGVAAAPNVIGPLSAHKRIIFLSIALASLIPIGVSLNGQQF